MIVNRKGWIVVDMERSEMDSDGDSNNSQSLRRFKVSNLDCNCELLDVKYIPMEIHGSSQIPKLCLLL